MEDGIFVVAFGGSLFQRGIILMCTNLLFFPPCVFIRNTSPPLGLNNRLTACDRSPCKSSTTFSRLKFSALNSAMFTLRTTLNPRIKHVIVLTNEIVPRRSAPPRRFVAPLVLREANIGRVEFANFYFNNCGNALFL